MRRLPIIGEYPPDWKEISDATWAAADHRCIRCGHPYRKGEHGKGEWTSCDELCTHRGPLALMTKDGPKVLVFIDPAGVIVRRRWQTHPKSPAYLVAQWRIGTVHHFDGNKANCQWWNLLALCQRCHLTIQSRVDPQQPYMFEHSEWLKPYVAGFYAHKYEQTHPSRIQIMLTAGELDRLLALERIA